MQALAVAAVVAASGARSTSGAGRGCCGSRTVVTLVIALTAANGVAGTVAASELDPGSNRGPADLHSDALSAELSRQL